MTTKPKYQMIPYKREDRDIYAGLDFNPGERPERPEALYQEPPLHEFNYLLDHYLATAIGRRDVLVTGACFLCYDRSNLNVRVEPDCLVAFGVDAAAIRGRMLYLPWEAGKMADFVLEMASQSTARNDVGPKRLLYERLGIGEYWRFDATGGRLYGEPLAGERLVEGQYQPIELTLQDDGSIRGYSPTIDAFLSWEPREEGQHRGWLHIYDPATGLRLESYTTLADSRRAAEERARRRRGAGRRRRARSSRTPRTTAAPVGAVGRKIIPSPSRGRVRVGVKTSRATLYNTR